MEGSKTANLTFGLLRAISKERETERPKRETISLKLVLLAIKAVTLAALFAAMKQLAARCFVVTSKNANATSASFVGKQNAASLSTNSSQLVFKRREQRAVGSALAFVDPDR